MKRKSNGDITFLDGPRHCIFIGPFDIRQICYELVPLSNLKRLLSEENCLHIHCTSYIFYNHLVLTNQFVWFSIDASMEENEHPPADLKAGDVFLKKVYEAVRGSPNWNSTLLLVTFDEHGGFYDPIPPPTNVPRPDDEPLRPFVNYFNFDRLGARVPTIAVSPWVEKGAVISNGLNGEIFEHSSIPGTLKKLFDLPSYLTRRDAWAATFDIAITRDEPRSDCPKTIDYHLGLKNE